MYSNTRRRPNRRYKKRNTVPQYNRVPLVSLDERMIPDHKHYVPSSKPIRMSFTYFAQMTADAAGQVGHRVSLRNPDRAFDGTGQYQDVANISNVFDTYKPEYLTIEGVPTYALTNFSVGSLIFAPDYEDNDVSQLVNTYAAAVSYADKKMIDPRYKFSIRYKVPPLTSGTIPGNLTTSPAPILQGGFLDFGSPPWEGVVYIVGGGFPANFPICDLVLTMDMLVKYKR